MNVKLHSEGPQEYRILLAMLANGAPVYRLAGADGQEDGDTEEDEEEDEEEGDDSGDTGEKTADSETVSKADFEKLKARMRAADKRAGAAENKLRELQDAGKPEAEKAAKELEELRAAHQQATEALNTARLENAVLKDTTFQWNDPEDVVEHALRALRKGDLEIDEDGDVEGVGQWLKDLAKRKPHFVKPAASEGDSEDDAAGPTGGNVGSGKKKGRAKVDEAALLKKFPALNR